MTAPKSPAPAGLFACALDMHARRLIAFASLPLAALLAWLLWAPAPPRAHRPTPAPAVAATPESAAAPSAEPAGVPSPAPAAERAIVTPVLPDSLQGTESDGGVTLDAHGRLVADLGLRRLYDHFLSSIGERSIDEIRALLAARLDEITTPDGKRQALAAFERYLRYLREVDAVGTQLSALPLRDRLQRLSELRRQHLGSEMADAFFADEEAYQRYTLDRQELAAEPALDPQLRAARERELLAELPESVREPLLAQQRVESDLVDASAIETLAGDADERHRLRVERFGEEAAARMELLDRERAAWEARVAAYRAERARLQALSASGRRAALDEYLARHFSETEQRRIRSLEDVGEL